ncbi:MAG: peptidylprolyl isomerase [Polyangiales bacterium]
MRFRHALAPAALIAALALAVPVAHGAIVERVVAVVGDQPILLTELRQRARPFLIKIYQTVPPQQQKVAEAEMYKELLGKLVDERVVSIAADKLNVTVSTKEVDDAIKLKAADIKVSINDLLSEAAKQGLSEADYREEVRRELLFGKMLETRVRSRVRVTEDDARTYFHRLEVQERRTQPYHAAIITLPNESRALADKIVKSARSGADFGALAKQFSTDASRSVGGDVGSKTPSSFGKPLDEAILHLAQGEISEPIFAGNRLVIVKVVERAPSTLPKYADVKDIVMNRVRDEMLQKQIKVWLDELKTGVYIDIRL